MANEVYANGREVSCKRAEGKSVACFPDVCFTPGPSPSGVPVPYPNTGLATDTTHGTRTVRISGQEAMLKDKSYFKTSYGDEAGCAPKRGVVTSVIKGKVYFTSWSMDVKFEGENVVRHLDLTTHNHASQPGNTAPWPYLDQMAIDAGGGPCKKDILKEKTACTDYKPYGNKNVCRDAGLRGRVPKTATGAQSSAERASANKCLAARRCQLVPFSPKDKKGIKGCCPAQTPDHLIPKSSFYKGSVKGGARLQGWKKYSSRKAPCICAEGGNNTNGSHGLRHSAHASLSKVEPGDINTLENEASLAAESATLTFPESKCNKRCIEAQLMNGHMKMTRAQAPKVKYSPSGSKLTSAEIKKLRAQKRKVG